MTKLMPVRLEMAQQTNLPWVRRVVVMIVPVRCQLAASVVVQDVRAAHPFQLYSFLFQELIYQVSVVDPLSLVSSTINSAGHTVPLFPDCSVELCRLPLPRTRVKVCLFSFLSS